MLRSSLAQTFLEAAACQRNRSYRSLVSWLLSGLFSPILAQPEASPSVNYLPICNKSEGPVLCGLTTEGSAGEWIESLVINHVAALGFD